jgi:hypothetical protein
MGGQILVVNVGGVVFSVRPIEWDHWMWSLFLGMGCLCWQLVINAIPTDQCIKLYNKIFGCCIKQETHITDDDKQSAKKEESNQDMKSVTQPSRKKDDEFETNDARLVDAGLI